MKAAAKLLRIHRQAMYWQKVSEARRVAADFEKTMRQVSATAGATADDLQRLSAQAIARDQQGSRGPVTAPGTPDPPALAF